MKLGWEELHLQACCYRAEDGTGETVMENMKVSYNHLPMSNPSVPGRKLFWELAVMQRNRNGLKGRAERIHREEEKWVLT